MPFLKISTLTTATAVSATNQFEINQNGASRSATMSQVSDFINNGVFSCRAWVQFSSSGPSIVIRGSGNVSSITDNGVGLFRVNFTTALADVNYACAGMAGTDSAGSTIMSVEGSNAVVSTTGVAISTRIISGAYVDRSVVMFEAFR